MSEVLNEERQTVVMDSICHSARVYFYGLSEAVWRDITTPFCRLRPKMYIDGDQWCALYGENLQDGVAGFGATPAEAEAAFNQTWTSHRVKSTAEEGK